MLKTSHHPFIQVDGVNLNSKPDAPQGQVSGICGLHIKVYYHCLRTLWQHLLIRLAGAVEIFFQLLQMGADPHLRQHRSQALDALATLHPPTRPPYQPQLERVKCSVVGPIGLTVSRGHQAHSSLQAPGIDEAASQPIIRSVSQSDSKTSGVRLQGAAHGATSTTAAKS